jgi:hypothetical protein
MHCGKTLIPPLSGAIQHGARSQNMTYFRLQFLIGPSITMIYPVLVYISGSRGGWTQARKGSWSENQN